MNRNTMWIVLGVLVIALLAFTLLGRRSQTTDASNPANPNASTSTSSTSSTPATPPARTAPAQ